MGFSLGAATINTIVTFGSIALVMVVGLIATAPDFAVAALTTTAVLVALVVGIGFYPISYTVWAAVDLAMRPLEPAEQAEAQAWLASRPTRTGRPG